MNKFDFQNHLIYTTLTKNSTTLYSCENAQLVHALNVNCSEIIAQELGLISSSKTLIGSIPVVNTGVNMDLAIFFIKKVLNNPDGSNDLVTLLAIAHANMNRALILSILKKIMDKYIEFKQDTESGDNVDKQKGKLGEFKLYMNQIIKFEEMNYDSNHQMYDYGSTQERDEEAGVGGEVISPKSLVLVNEEVAEVRQLMLDNINKLMSRGDKINLLVDQTDRLTSSSSVFQKRAQLIRRKMWLTQTKFYILMVVGLLVIIYLIVGSGCGYPFFGRCRH